MLAEFPAKPCPPVNSSAVQAKITGGARAGTIFAGDPQIAPYFSPIS